MMTQLKEPNRKNETTKLMTLIQAINDGMRLMLEEDNRTIILGEDIGKNGGVFRATEGLQEQFGDDRVVDTPLSEAGIIGTSIGLAVNGFVRWQKSNSWVLSTPRTNRL